MLKEIFKELDPNIQIEGLSLTCYEEDGTTVLGKHSRTYALIDDAKYNIHGLFALDPTWDSYKRNGREKLGDDYTALDLYDHFLIPFSEYGEVFQHESPLAFFGKDYSDLNQNSIDVKKIEENNVFEQLKELMNLILNDKEAYNKISKSYEEQKGKEFGLQAFIRVYEFIFNEYVNEMNNLTNKANGMFARPQNREQRRNNNRNNYRGNKYRRY